MTTEQCQQINEERLQAWSQDLVAAHATPVLLVGIGHDQASGEIHLCVTRDMNRECIAAFLRKALDQI